MRLVQVREGSRHVAAIVEGDTLQKVSSGQSVYHLAGIAETENTSLCDVLSSTKTNNVSYDKVVRDNALVCPYTHPDPFQMMVAGTGLSHLGSADTRSKMHAGLKAAELTDSMRMFKAGLEGGKPDDGEMGEQSEWFYKGDGSTVIPPGAAYSSPEFAEDMSEEPELVSLYRIACDGTPMRIGFALANEASDHVTEQKNYLLLSHSKLRQSSIGPEIVIGDIPTDIRGQSKVIRNGEVVWESEFLTGEDNMCHSIKNLEDHHFKYDLFRRPGQAHIHFLGTATLSFGDGIVTQPGDEFHISAEGFGRPLINSYDISKAPSRTIRVL